MGARIERAGGLGLSDWEDGERAGRRTMRRAIATRPDSGPAGPGGGGW
jgi:hypothetical protein